MLARHGLPHRMSGTLGVEDVLAAAARDKKSDGRSLNMVLLEAPGVVRLGVDPPADLLRAAVAEVLA